MTICSVSSLGQWPRFQSEGCFTDSALRLHEFDFDCVITDISVPKCRPDSDAQQRQQRRPEPHGGLRGLPPKWVGQLLNNEPGSWWQGK